jgi:ribosomal protein L21E
MTSLYFAIAGGAVALIVWHTVMLIMVNRPNHAQPSVDVLPVFSAGDHVITVQGSWSYNLQDYRYRVGETGKVLHVINSASIVVELPDQREFIMPAFQERRYYE